MTVRTQNADCCHRGGARTRDDASPAVAVYGNAIGRSRPLYGVTRAYPPFYPGPAFEHLTCHTPEGAARQAQIIRQAWRQCGVVPTVEIITERLREAKGPRETMHSVRVRLVGGLPGRVG